MNNYLRNNAYYVCLIPYKGKLNKKWTLVIGDKNENILKKVHFGSADMEDYTIHKDDKRKENFLRRFNKLIQKNKTNPFSPMTLSHMILWNKKSLTDSFKDYAEKYNLKIFLDFGTPLHFD